MSPVRARNAPIDMDSARIDAALYTDDEKPAVDRVMSFEKTGNVPRLRGWLHSHGHIIAKGWHATCTPHRENRSRLVAGTVGLL
jgi:hypothetical protein